MESVQEGPTTISSLYGLEVANYFPEFYVIENPEIRTTLKSFFLEVPKHFATQPSSSSGRYHPEDEFALGGNVLHTRRVVRVVQHLCDLKGWSGLERDLLVAAALVHDTGQYGWGPEPRQKTVDRHELVPYINTQSLLGKAPYYLNLVGLAALHSGRWGPRLDDLPGELQSPARSMSLNRWLHIADLLASRREILVDVERGFDE